MKPDPRMAPVIEKALNEQSTHLREIPHPPFQEKMQRFYGQMEQALYAAECTCHNDGEKCMGETCPFSATTDRPFPPCSLSAIRYAIGDHPSHFCQPCEPTQPECGKCHGPERQPCFGYYDNSMACRMPGCPDRVQCRESTPKCPKCGSPTFRANIDDQDMILCYNDACKWKGPAEIGQCRHAGQRTSGLQECNLPSEQDCKFQSSSDGINFACAQEAAALAAIAKYGQEDRR